MSSYNEEPFIPMQEINNPYLRHSRSSYQESNRNSGDYNNMRPNRVISGHRRLNTIYVGPKSNFENHANKIVEKMEENESLMEDTPISEQLRKEALRELPQCLTMKRCVKLKLSKSVSQKSKKKPISLWKRLKYRTSVKFAKFKYSVKNFNYFELWHETLKDIEGHFGSGYASYFKFLRWLFVMNFFISVVSFALLSVPQIIYDKSGNNGTIKNSEHFHFKDMFTGDGFFNNTILYYGHYTNNNINLLPYLYFDMPVAYFSVVAILYLIYFFVLAVSVAQSYRRTFIETEGGLQNVFANKIFCGWDYAIANKEAAELKSSAIFHELKELLSESFEEKGNRTCLNKFWICSIQIIVNTLILTLLVAIGWSCWLLLEQFSSEEDDKVIVTAVVVNIVITIFPLIFNYISKYEDYNNPRTALYITLLRTYILGAVIVGVILTFWLANAKKFDCWENRLGAEIHRLIVFDFIFSVVLTTLLEIAYFFIQKLRGKNSKTEFKISQHTLLIIYNQALFWVGLLYSPILPLIVTIKMFVIWYVREGYVRKFCKPPKRSWRAAQSQTWFMMLSFISITLIVAVHGYTVKSVSTSNCGPFKHLTYIYQIVTQNASNLERKDNVWKIIMYITKPGAIALIMVALGILVYYLREQAYARKEKVKMLREMLAWMGNDKKFLVKWYSEVTKRQTDISFYDKRFIDPSQILPHEANHGNQTFLDLDSNASTSLHEDNFSSRFTQYS